jgi:DNA replication licensing factor MCM5
LVKKVKPGTRFNLIGIYKIFYTKVASKKNERFDAAVRKPYIEVVGFEEINATEKKGTFEPEEEEEIRELSRHSDIQDMIAKSIAPAIWSNEDIKKAIACLLFGGSRKILPDGMRLRGDINVLLLGDPSVAKISIFKICSSSCSDWCVYIRKRFIRSRINSISIA